MPRSEQFEDHVATALGQAGIEAPVHFVRSREYPGVARGQGEILPRDIQPGAASGLAPGHARPWVPQQPCAVFQRPFDFDAWRYRQGSRATGVAVQRDETAEPVAEP